MSVDELIKCVIVASANDAALTLAERVGGSEEAFVNEMNKRARELGMKNTHFENVTGLDDDVTNHLTSAYDIALMSKELLKHEKVSSYTTIWTDSIRNGEFVLTNTNRLIRYYRGITGLKTGYTSGAGFCISASAKRDNLHLIAVVMNAKSSSERNSIATKLLDYGFSNYCLYEDSEQSLGSIKVLRGAKDEVKIGCSSYSLLENIGNKNKVEKEIVLSENVNAPISKGDVVGKIIYKLNGNKIGENDIYCLEKVNEISFIKYFLMVLENFVLN